MILQALFRFYNSLALKILLLVCCIAGGAYVAFLGLTPLWTKGLLLVIGLLLYASLSSIIEHLYKKMGMYDER